jgi:hypothetical protein
MTPTKILAIIFAVAILVKLAFLIIRPRLWARAAHAVIGNYATATVIYLILAAIVGYYVLTSINIVEVAAVMLFASLLIGLSLAPYAASLVKLSDEVMQVGLGKTWLALVIWGLLALWVLYAVFS